MGPENSNPVDPTFAEVKPGFLQRLARDKLNVELWSNQKFDEVIPPLITGFMSVLPLSIAIYSFFMPPPQPWESPNRIAIASFVVVCCKVLSVGALIAFIWFKDKKAFILGMVGFWIFSKLLNFLDAVL